MKSALEPANASNVAGVSLTLEQNYSMLVETWFPSAVFYWQPTADLHMFKIVLVRLSEASLSLVTDTRTVLMSNSRFAELRHLLGLSTS